MIARARRVVLLLAASDVTLLQVQAPPLSAAKLMAALPNLVEDRLLGDPADSVAVARSLTGGLHAVAITQLALLDTMANALHALGAHQILALPSQLCLPFSQPDSAAAAISEHNDGIEITLRLSAQDGIGLAIRPAQHETAAHEVIATLCTIVPKVPITLYVPSSSLRTYQSAASQPDIPNNHINVLADNWPRWIEGAQNITLNLMAGMGGSSANFNWRPWRWPLALAFVVLLINISALNFDWWRMKNEAAALRTAMVQIYKSAYPNETVILDPIAQMRQKISAAQQKSGLAAADDFIVLAASFGEAWANVAATTDKASAITAIEYHEGSLLIRLKSGSENLMQQMKVALARLELSLELVTSNPPEVAWKIRSAR